MAFPKWVSFQKLHCVYKVLLKYLAAYWGRLPENDVDTTNTVWNMEESLSCNSFLTRFCSHELLRYCLWSILLVLSPDAHRDSSKSSESLCVPADAKNCERSGMRSTAMRLEIVQRLKCVNELNLHIPVYFYFYPIEAFYKSRIFKT